MSEQPTRVDEAPRLVSLRTLVVSVVVTWVLSVGAALALPFASIGGPGASERSDPRAGQASRPAARSAGLAPTRVRAPRTDPRRPG